MLTVLEHSHLHLRKLANTLHSVSCCNGFLASHLLFTHLVTFPSPTLLTLCLSFWVFLGRCTLALVTIATAMHISTHTRVALLCQVSDLQIFPFQAGFSQAW